MTSDNVSPPSLTFDVTDSCYGVDVSGQTWTYNTPFKLRDDNGNKKVVINLAARGRNSEVTVICSCVCLCVCVSDGSCFETAIT